MGNSCCTPWTGLQSTYRKFRGANKPTVSACLWLVGGIQSILYGGKAQTPLSCQQCPQQLLNISQLQQLTANNN